MDFDDPAIDGLTELIIGCAIEVHRVLGPGVEDVVIVELKSVERLHPIHSAQVITYLKLTGRPAGLLFNFNATSLRAGLRRLYHPDRYKKKPSS